MAAKTRKAGRAGNVAGTVPAKVKSVGEAVKVNAQGVAGETVARLLENDRAGGYRTYGEIVDTAAFREAAELICEAHENDGGERVELLAQLLIKARLMTAGHKSPLWIGTYDEADWGRRQGEMAELIRRAADAFDNMPGIKKNKDTIESALERYLCPGTLDVSKRENVVKLAEHDLLGVVLRQFASNIEQSAPSEICPRWVHMNSMFMPGITRELAGKRGKAKVSLEHENRGTLVRALDKIIPPGVANRNGVIARLASLAGVAMDHRAVGKILEYRKRRSAR